jgi:hypothetical protein
VFSYITVSALALFLDMEFGLFFLVVSISNSSSGMKWKSFLIAPTRAVFACITYHVRGRERRAVQIERVGGRYLIVATTAGVPAQTSLQVPKAGRMNFFFPAPLVHALQPCYEGGGEEAGGGDM